MKQLPNYVLSNTALLGCSYFFQLKAKEILNLDCAYKSGYSP